MELDRDQILRGVDSLSNRLREPSGQATFNRVMALISLLAGTVFIVGVGWWIHHLHIDESMFRRATAQGQVTENRLEYGAWLRSRFRPGYRAVVQFRLQSGGSVTMKDWLGSRPPLFSVGQTVTVFYDPDAPEQAVIDHGPKFLAGLCIPFVMGFLMLLGGTQRLLRARSEPGEPPARPTP